MSFYIRVLISAGVLFGLRGWSNPSAGGAAAALLVSLVVCFAASRSRASGPELVVALASLQFGLAAFINIPEGVLFDVIQIGAAPLVLARALFDAIATATVVTALFGRMRAEESEPVEAAVPTVAGLLWRLAAAALIFVACYFVGGIVIIPYVRDYCQGRAMPKATAIVSMQVLRALAIIAALYPALRTMRWRRDAQVLAALGLPAIGLSELLPANDLMPPRVRLVHALEMTPYYAFYGWLVARWFGIKAPGTGTPASHQ